MRPLFFITLIVTIIFSTGYLYYSVAAVCQVPLRYSIGEFDNGFPLTNEDAIEALRAAEAVWEEPASRELFIYDETASFVVNFVFDERQARSEAEDSWRETLDSNEATSAEVAVQYNQVLRDYKQLEAAYQDRVDRYEAELLKFNTIVAAYNTEGGAPREVYEDLQDQERNLNQQKDILQKDALELEGVVESLNALGQRGNELIEKYNAGVSAYNTTFGEVDEFTQGDYRGNEINIYTFKDQNELVRVLVHEFGHALDIGHVEGSQSMMYYLMEDQPTVPVLSDEDKAAFIATCGTGEGIGYRVRTLITSIISKF